MKKENYTPSYIPDRKRKKTFWEKLKGFFDDLLDIFRSDRNDPTDFTATW